MTNLGVSVIICCHNSAKRLPDTLTHLMAQIVPGDIQWEVLVIDNASTDDTAQVAKDHWWIEVPLRVVSEPRLGLINARMTGFHESKYEYFSFIDDDNWVVKDWVRIIYERMNAQPEVGIIGGPSQAVFEIEPPKWFERYQHSYGVGPQHDREGILPYGDILWGTGAYRKSAWKMILDNGFSPVLVGRQGKNLLGGEDNEIAYMLLLAGWKFYYELDLKFKHFIPASRLNWQYICRMMKGYGRAFIYIKYYQDIINKHDEFQNSWQNELWKDFKIIIRQLGVFTKCLLINNIEGNEQVLELHLFMGKLEERLGLLCKISDKFKQIDQQTQNYL